MALCPWASVPGDPKKYVYEMCELLGKRTTDAKEIVKFLRTVDTKKLLEVQGKIGLENVHKIFKSNTYYIKIINFNVFNFYVDT